MQVKTVINKQPKLFLKDYVHTPESLRVFVLNLVCSYNILYDTYYIDDPHLIQCHKNRNRSLGDLFNITKPLYPKVTVKEFKSILIDYAQNSKINVLPCPRYK